MVSPSLTQWHTTNKREWMLVPKSMNRSSSSEWSGSAISRPNSSVKAVLASWKETLCFFWLAASLLGSHSKIRCFINYIVVTLQLLSRYILASTFLEEFWHRKNFSLILCLTKRNLLVFSWWQNHSLFFIICLSACLCCRCWCLLRMQKIMICLYIMRWASNSMIVIPMLILNQSTLPIHIAPVTIVSVQQPTVMPLVC